MPNVPPDELVSPPVAEFDPRYVVERELGRGAMGRVFLARDLRLDRLVAIKALPPGNRDPRELSRLEHEARAAGSLNHPNIIAVHDIGASAAGPFIVSEYLRGKTLREVLDEGPMPLPRALELAAQLAAGLTAAHERGIVHRDLKPENLLVTEEGWLKILDFGIAKRTNKALLPTPPDGVHPVQPAFDPAALEGLGPQTNPGQILGTIGYMSPEQVRGRPADARSDLFAFGEIFYEMLAGARAFRGKTPFAVCLAILHGEPQPLPDSIPAEVRGVLARCLAKEPQQRYQTAQELRIQLEALLPGARGQTQPAPTRMLWLLAALLLLALGAAFVAMRRPHRAPPSFRQLTFHPGAVWAARFGPAGKVFYSAAWDGKPPVLFVTEPGKPEPKKLALPDAMLLSVSPAGDLAVLLNPTFRGTTYRGGALAVFSADGGSRARQRLEGVDAADYGPQGELAIVRASRLGSTIELPAGHVLVKSAGVIPSLRFSRKGDLIAYIEYPQPTDDAGAVAVVDRAGKKRVLAGGFRSLQGLAWSPSGEEVWVTAVATSASEGTLALRAIGMDGSQRTLTQVGGDLLLNDVAPGRGALLTQPNRRLGVGLLDGEQRERDLSWFDRSFLDDVSRDGKRVLLTVDGAAAGPAYSVYVRETDGSAARKLADGYSGALSPDGETALIIPFSASEPLSLQKLTGGQAQRLPPDGLAITRARFLPDGRRILLVGQEAGHAPRLYVRALDEPRARPITPEGIVGVGLTLSADGTRVAVLDDHDEAVIFPLDGSPSQRVPGFTPGDVPFGWGEDGLLFVGRLVGMPVVIDRLDPRTGKRERWGSAAPRDPSAIMITRVMVTADGRSLVYNYAGMTTPLFLVQGIE